MKIVKLEVKSFEGLKEISITPSDGVNLIVGRNGAGKTSLLEAIRGAFTNKTAERSQVVMSGEDNGIILFEMDNGYDGLRHVEPGGRVVGGLEMTNSDNEIMGKAQTFLNSIAPGFGFNPLDFIELKDEQQTKMLLDLVDVKVGRPTLISIGGGVIDGVDYNRHPLQVLSDIESKLAEQRREVGRKARDLEGMVEKLRESVPVEFDLAEFEKFSLESAVNELNEIKANEQADLTKREKIASISAQIDSLNERIEALKQELDRELNYMPLLSDSDKLSMGERQEQINGSITAYRKNSEYAKTLQQASEAELEAQETRTQYQALCQTIDNVRSKPGELLETVELPVDGMGIVDGKVTVNGIQISDLSTGEQLMVAARVAVATLGELKVVLVDGLERLDKDNQEKLLDYLSRSGVQAFVTDVSDGELTIITNANEDNEEDYNEVPF